jgi:hypothetical protein
MDLRSFSVHAQSPRQIECCAELGRWRRLTGSLLIDPPKQVNSNVVLDSVEVKTQALPLYSRYRVISNSYRRAPFLGTPNKTSLSRRGSQAEGTGCRRGKLQEVYVCLFVEAPACPAGCLQAGARTGFYCLCLDKSIDSLAIRDAAAPAPPSRAPGPAKPGPARTEVPMCANRG